ncbi:MAG TPA: ATP-binding protein [Vicinamibacterales bacterium]|nr:ATP-binding protein [Vicinamibacterales bacterium]
MVETSSALVSARLEKASSLIGAVALAVGSGVLATWVWSWPGLSRIHPVLGGMGAHTALGFVLVSTSLLLLRPPVSAPRRIASSMLAAAVVAMAITMLGRWAEVSLGGLLPGRMPTASAEVFLGFGLALLTLDVRLGRARPAEFFSFASALIALFALVAYTMGSFSIVTSVNVRPLAFHSVLLMVAFSFALLAARPRVGLMSLVTSDTVAGLMVRRMLPAVVGIPIVIGWLATEAQRGGVVPPFLTVPYYAVAIVVVFATMTWQIAGSLHRIDTQRVEAQRQVQELNADLERRVADRTAELARVNSELEAFSYSVSHDLRAPLRHIDGFSQMLATRHAGTLDETGRRHIAIIREGAQNMGKMIDDLLSLARLDRKSLTRERTDLNAIVRKVAQDLQPEIGARHVEWSLEPLPAVDCDRGLITLVLTNLLSNAVKYTSKREVAKISVSARTTSEGVVFAVSDNGAGFDQTYQDKLFGVFQRLHRADEFEGTGIGLATVRRIIHKHGGRIWAEAAVDRGATFFFTLTNPTN